MIVFLLCSLTSMRIGIPKEVKQGETRVAVTPQGVRELVRRKHEVLIQKGAGVSAGFRDQDFRKAGGKIVHDIGAVYRRSELLCKVKEPQAKELTLLKAGQIIFSFLHLAGNLRLAKQLRAKKIIAISFETIQMKDGRLPLLMPMSQIAGRLAALMGANLLRYDLGGKGVLLSGVYEESNGTVGVIGCGHVGRAAIEVAHGLGATVYAFDKDPARLDALKAQYQNRLLTFRSGSRDISEIVSNADLLIGAVLNPGEKAPCLVSEKMVKRMDAGSVIIDVSIDEGGCVETSRATSIKKPSFVKHGILHCAIPNLPALVPRTSTHLLADQVFPYLMQIAEFGWEKAVENNQSLKRALMCDSA